MAGIGYSRYEAAQANEMDQARLILMMYAGAQRFIGKAVEAAGDDTGEMMQCVFKAKNVLLELMSSINPEEGGSMAVLLLQNYSRMYARLGDAARSADTDELNAVKNDLAALEESWRQVFSGPEYRRFKKSRAQTKLHAAERV